MNIIDILEDNLTGEPLKDAVIIAILFTVLWTFYNVLFESVFSLFRKN